MEHLERRDTEFRPQPPSRLAMARHPSSLRRRVAIASGSRSFGGRPSLLPFARACLGPRPHSLHTDRQSPHRSALPGGAGGTAVRHNDVLWKSHFTLRPLCVATVRPGWRRHPGKPPSVAPARECARHARWTCARRLLPEDPRQVLSGSHPVR